MQVRLLNIDTALLTQRTVIRRFREGDGELLYNLVQENHAHLQDLGRLQRDTSSAEESECFVRKCLSGWHLQEDYCFGVWHNKSAKLIGMLRIFGIDWEVPKAEAGYFISQEYTQQGLMTECLLAVLRFTFRQLEIEKLNLRVSMDNVASQRLARKCGFRREGDLRSDYRRPSGELADTMLFGLTRPEYLGV